MAAPAPTDAALVVAARANESWAREALFLRHLAMVDGLAYRLAPRHDEADDIVQESFAQAFDDLHRLKDPQAFAGWLKTIVVRTAARTLRRHRLLRRLGLEHATPIDPSEVVSSAVPPDVGAELRLLYAVIEALPARVRTALVLRRVDRMTVREIATHLQCSEGTVKRLIGRGDALLAKASPKVQP